MTTSELKGVIPGLPAGVIHEPYLSEDEQRRLLEAVIDIVAAAPLVVPTMPKSGRPFSVRMTSCGALGWVSDREGYRYQPTHPRTGRPWPPIPDMLMQIWRAATGYPHPPEACLVNYYAGTAKMGLHQDVDEDDLAAPVVSVSLGDDCRFRVGGTTRSGPTRSIRLRSGDLVVLGGPSRLAFHGVDRLYPGTSRLLEPWMPEGGRINLTLRRVTIAIARTESRPA